ncbi:unnamed protein product, partial [Gongylonema pulchrum]|uniref:Helicase n=1 Tax=Gongylonema pulchrum TaxID=637853 RepID=A0A183DHI1_9BILA
VAAEECDTVVYFQILVNIGNEEEDVARVYEAMQHAQRIFDEIRQNPTKGYLTYKTETNSDGTTFEAYQEFHPFKFSQLNDKQCKEFDSFSDCVDEFFSKMESQKIETKALNAERDALKKLDNIIKDQKDRIAALELAQSEKEEIAELIELNSDLVEKALLVVRKIIASQVIFFELEIP